MVIEYQGIAAERGMTRHEIADLLGLTEPADELPASRIARSPIRDP